MSGSRRDSGDSTRGGPEHGRSHKPTDDNKSGSSGKGSTGSKDSNAGPKGGGVSPTGTPGA